MGSLAFAIRPGLADAAGDIDLAGFAQAIAEGLTLGEFNAGSYKTADPAPGPSPRCTIVLPDVPDTSPESPARHRVVDQRAAACLASAAILRGSFRTSPETR